MATLTRKHVQMFHKNIKSLLLAYSFYRQSLRGSSRRLFTVSYIIQLNHLNTLKWVDIDEDMDGTCKEKQPNKTVTKTKGKSEIN